MQGPINERDKIVLPLLIAIVSTLIAAPLLYFLKFFGSSIRAKIIHSIKVPENAELYTNILLVLMLCLLGLSAFIVFFLIWRKKDIRDNTEDQLKNHGKNKINNGAHNNKPEIFHKILQSVVKLASQHAESSPKIIGGLINETPQIVLAYLREMEAESIVVFANGGKSPDINTSFFISYHENPWKYLKIESS
jgi:hypothetical protein